MRTIARWQTYGTRLLMMLAGSSLLAFTYYHINFQNGLSEGGFVGLALLGKYLFNLPPALTMIALDLPIVVLAWWLKGHRFVLNTVVASLTFSLVYELCEQFSPLSMNLHGNLPLAALLSGLLTGFGAGLVLRAGGASGGDDILSMLLSQWSGIKIGTMFIIMDAVVLTVSLLYLPFKETMFTILAVLIAGKVITWTVHYGQGQLTPMRLPYHPIKEKTARA
ncbi:MULTISPECIES: YitT family protein [Paenibacillus]|uniref:YitT family protein n=1 Tax=Paenibacillus TaxID=44249 RepID=UPI00048EC275|nr:MULTISPECIES: YitT family protein [Paenibacillus]MCT2195649.1 YitT family protein [Paenibacillus sp. p3-SID1389]MDU0332044.1 YitT family protein [Paenibacillus sp. 3LSP]MEC2343390.1 YitT family protein [Paenibacillus barengoltzii]